MPTISLELLGAVIVAIVVFLGIIKIFADWLEKRNDKDNEFVEKFTEMNERHNNSLNELKTCLNENTLATRSTKEYLERVEKQHDEKFKDHDRRLNSLDDKVDDLDKQVIKIDMQINKGSD